MRRNHPSLFSLCHKYDTAVRERKQWETTKQKQNSTVNSRYAQTTITANYSRRLTDITSSLPLLYTHTQWIHSIVVSTQQNTQQSLTTNDKDTATVNSRNSDEAKSTYVRTQTNTEIIANHSGNDRRWMTRKPLSLNIWDRHQQCKIHSYVSSYVRIRPFKLDWIVLDWAGFNVSTNTV